MGDNFRLLLAVEAELDKNPPDQRLSVLCAALGRQIVRAWHDTGRQDVNALHAARAIAQSQLRQAMERYAAELGDPVPPLNGAQEARGIATELERFLRDKPPIDGEVAIWMVLGKLMAIMIEEGRGAKQDLVAVSMLKLSKGIDAHLTARRNQANG